MREIIKKIGEKVLKEFFDFENNEYTLEYDEEYGCYEGGMSFCGDFEHYSIEGNVKVRGGNLLFIEMFLTDGMHPNVEQAVNDYIEEHFDSCEWYDLCCDDSRDNSMDEFQRNGFRDEADYWHYRLSA